VAEVRQDAGHLGVLIWAVFDDGACSFSRRTFHGMTNPFRLTKSGAKRNVTTKWRRSQRAMVSMKEYDPLPIYRL
jgi:hypothetical protein